MGDDQDMEKGNDTETYLREQDRFLPIANVSRIMKRAVPPIGKVSVRYYEGVSKVSVGYYEGVTLTGCQ